MMRTGEGLREATRCELQRGFSPPTAAAELLKFCNSRPPKASQIRTGRFKALSQQATKILCYDVDDDMWAPQYKFADMSPEDYHLRLSGIRGAPLESLVRRVNAAYGTDINHIANNCYPTKSDCIPSHTDQAFSIMALSRRATRTKRKAKRATTA